MWSVGSIIYVALTGRRPDDRLSISDANTEDLASRQDRFDVCFGFLPAKISSRAKDFMRRCLQIAESQRITATEAASHPWFTCDLYSAELLAQYRRAIYSWQPRPATEEIVEYCVAEETCAADLHAEASHTLSMLSGMSIAQEDVQDRQRISLDFIPPRSTQLSGP